MLHQQDHTPSFYADSINHPLSFDCFNENNTNTDVCIIGGGYTGLSSALHLSQKGFTVHLLEANKIAWGASGRNGGQVCSGFNKDQETLESMFGKSQALRLWQIGEKAKILVKQLIADHRIECDYADGIIHAAFKSSDVSELKEETDLLRNRYNYQDIHFLDKDAINKIVASPLYHGGQIDMGAGHLHPLNFAHGLAKAALQSGANIYQDSLVSSYQKTMGNSNYPMQVKLANGKSLNAKYVIVATNGYLGKLDNTIAPYIMPLNNFIAVTEPLTESIADALISNNAAVADSKFVVNYYRLSGGGNVFDKTNANKKSMERRMVYGGGENYTSSFPKDIASFVIPHMAKTFPQLKDIAIDYAWGGTLAVTMNRLPDFGLRDSRIFHMAGYSGQGVALATLAGKLVAEKIDVGMTSDASGQENVDDFDLIATLTQKKFPGGTLLRKPGQIAGMLYYSLKDRLGK